MIFEITKELLMDALIKTVPIAEKKSTLPILSHLLINAQDSKLIITATDLEVGLQMSYDCIVEQEGTLAVPSKKFLEIVKELAPGPIKIVSVDRIVDEEGLEVNVFRMKILSGETAVELAGMDPSDYPVWLSLEDAQTASIKAEDLINMIEKTLFASSNDESRFNLNGVCVEKVDDKTRMVSTDGHRLALIDKDINLTIENRVIIPKKGLQEVRRIAENIDGEVVFGCDEKNVLVRTDKFMMTVRIVDGEYPDYRKVIPQPGDKIIKTARLPLMQCLKRVGILTSDRNRGINVDFSPGMITLTAKHPDLGTARDQLEADYDGEEFSVLVNPYYLIESLNAIDTETVAMECRSEGAPIIVKPEPADTYFNLVMPMRKGN